MGNFYTNYTLKGPSQQAVASAMAGRTSVVTPEYNGCIMVFDEESDSQDPDVISQVGKRLSRDLNCPVLAVLNHDDDILWFQLHENGKPTDEYDSTPDYFDGGEEPAPPTGGDAQKLCAVFGSGDSATVESILRNSLFDKGGYVFAFQRHADLVNALGLPEFGVGNSYASFDDPTFDYPDGLPKRDLVRTS